MSSQEGLKENKVRQVREEEWGDSRQIVIYKEGTTVGEFEWTQSRGSTGGGGGAALSRVRAWGERVGQERRVSRVSLRSWALSRPLALSTLPDA